jgi:selenide,water dikinase
LQLLFPENFPTDVMTEIFRGGAEKMAEVDAVIAGGHTGRTPSQYGLSITGLIHPDRIAAAQVAHRLIPTKSLTGLIDSTAAKNGSVR